MKLWLAKVMGRANVGLIPTDDISKQVLSRLADGECVQIELVRPRSVPMHRMYFGICREIGKNQDPQRTESSVDYELRVLAGHYEVMHIGHRRKPWWLGTLVSLLEVHGRLGKWLAKRVAARLTHHQVLIPKRIAFDKLSHDEWMELWPSLELAIREHFGNEYIREAA